MISRSKVFKFQAMIQIGNRFQSITNFEGRGNVIVTSRYAGFNTQKEADEALKTMLLRKPGSWGVVLSLVNSKASTVMIVD